MIANTVCCPFLLFCLTNAHGTAVVNDNKLAGLLRMAQGDPPNELATKDFCSTFRSLVCHVERRSPGRSSSRTSR